MPGQPINRARGEIIRAVEAHERGFGVNYVRRLVPSDRELGIRGRSVLLKLALDDENDPRVRLCAAVELVKLGLAEEERERIRDAAETGQLAGMSDAELEALAAEANERTPSPVPLSGIAS
jgi:hypothetical protein